MEQFDTPGGQKRTGIIVVTLVVIGLALVGTGGYLVYSKRQESGGGSGSGAANAQELGQWCKIRQEWAKKVDSLVGDILLKSIKAQDKAELDKLVVNRNMISQDYARQLRELQVTDPTLQEIEVALVKEGKTRANVSVEIDKLLAKIDAPDTAALRENREKLDRYIKGRISQGRSKADEEVAEAAAKLGDSKCSDIYRGPITDEGTSGNPYVSWDELELKRGAALRQFDDKIKEMEPVEQFTNRIYHEMVRLYRPTLKKCYEQAKARNPKMSDKLGLRVRLKRDGKIATLAIEWMINRDEKILDCLLAKAAKWRLPPPDPQINVVVVTLDFSTL